MSRPMLLVLLLFTIACWVQPVQAQAPAPQEKQIRRCTSPSGKVIYTDQKCNAVGAVSTPAGRRSYAYDTPRISCHHQLRSLLGELRFALVNHDTNRLASLYHWPGISAEGGYRIIERLDQLAERRLVNVTVQRPANRVAAEPAVAVAAPGFARWMEARQRPSNSSPRVAPTAIRVTQTASNGGDSQRQTVLRLHRRLGCWWVGL